MSHGDNVEFVRAICEACGLRNVVSLELKFEANKAPLVTAVMIPPGAGMLSTVKRFALSAAPIRDDKEGGASA